MVTTGQGYYNIKKTIYFRGSPLSTEKWDALQDADGRIVEVEGVKQLIFRGVSKIFFDFNSGDWA